jgi:DNA-binding transcriptional ArsR family regulator
MIAGMLETQVLTTDKQRKAFLHPIRSKVLQMLAQRPLTISNVAKELDVHPANLTHHFRKLQDAGLIKIHEERDIGKVVERYYLATARNIEIDQEVDGANAKVLSFLRNDLTSTIGKIKPDDSESVIGLIKRSKINEAIFKEFAEKLTALIEEFSARSIDGQKTYALNVSLYPHSVDYGQLKQIHLKKKRKK